MNPVQARHPVALKSNLMLSSHRRLGLCKWVLSLRVPHNPVCALPLPNSSYIPHAPYRIALLLSQGLLKVSQILFERIRWEL
jgi:hypothetical protein